MGLVDDNEEEKIIIYSSSSSGGFDMIGGLVGGELG